MSTTLQARVFLGLNCAFSTASGILLLVLPETLSEILFIEPASWVPLVIQGIGLGLVIFALDLLLMTLNSFVTRLEVMLIVAADVAWIVASIAFALLAMNHLTETGILLIDIVALCVAVFAIGQFLGARRITPPSSKASVTSRDGYVIASVRRAVAAPVSAVWKVMNDHPGYAEVASNLSKVEVLSGDGIGMQRRCYGPKGEHWTETCDAFEVEQSYGFTIHTDAPDYPYPISDLKGRWSVTPVGNGAEFAIDITARPKGNFLMRLLFLLAAKKQFKGVLVQLADRWSERMEREARA
ncbi:MAG: SRPBCC family protein [Roseibium sp.]|uniref:SRPBCC family protein n=1 Tax=Roseibium sp. TaxID=1936156 RepID=UPI00261CF33F|nr:SRPBCC family protein [Roseibium sp.]MCV0425943.1 SRPBCC family protein [Roseibium sp.]